MDWIMVKTTRLYIVKVCNSSTSLEQYCSLIVMCPELHNCLLTNIAGLLLIFLPVTLIFLDIQTDKQTDRTWSNEERRDLLFNHNKHCSVPYHAYTAYQANRADEAPSHFSFQIKTLRWHEEHILLRGTFNREAFGRCTEKEMLVFLRGMHTSPCKSIFLLIS